MKQKYNEQKCFSDDIAQILFLYISMYFNGSEHDSPQIEKHIEINAILIIQLCLRPSELLSLKS